MEETEFFDMDGVRLEVGDIVKPISGPTFKIVSKENVENDFEDYGYCMLGQNIEKETHFVVLSAESLSLRWRKVTE